MKLGELHIHMAHAQSYLSMHVHMSWSNSLWSHSTINQFVDKSSSTYSRTYSKCQPQIRSSLNTEELVYTLIETRIR